VLGILLEVLGDQGMQRSQPVDSLRQPTPGQPAAVLVDELDVVMGLGPVISDEQHRASASSGPASPHPNLEEKTVAT